MKKLFLFLFFAAICAGAAELPKRFTVASGDLKVDVSKESFWNISGARYRGKVVARPNSWLYGDCLTERLERLDRLRTYGKRHRREKSESHIQS